jgi:hypothetical protein
MVGQKSISIVNADRFWADGRVPAGVRLVAGMTATVQLDPRP